MIVYIKHVLALKMPNPVVTSLPKHETQTIAFVFSIKQQFKQYTALKTNAMAN